MTDSTVTDIAKMESPGFTGRQDASAARVLSLGIVGAGEIVSRIHLPALSACEGIRMTYIADKNPKAVQSVADSYRIAAVAATDDLEKLPQTDVVLLAVPVSARLPYYELFAKRGTCVLAEKPMAACETDAQRICDMYPDHALACGFQRRSYASVATAKSIVRENWFGPLRSISVSEGAITTRTGVDSRFYDDAASGGGGVLMDLGCHSLDTAIYISDAIEAIPVRQSFFFDGGVDREIDARLSLRTAHGSCDLDFFVTWLRPAKNAIELRFDNCVVEFPCQPSESLTVRGSGDGNVASLTMKHSAAATTYQAFYLEWMAFLDGVRTFHPSKFSARSCLPTIRAIEALYKAGRRA
jgi:predicted dehydrogenase